MRFGIISDIHANLEALTAVLEHLDGVDAIYCPGDIVGYGADPDLCCDIIRTRAKAAVIGNHDAAAAGQMDISWFNYAAKRAVLWTRDRLSQQNTLYLQNLPPELHLPEFLMVHATPADPLEFNYITSTWDARLALQSMHEANICFFCHSHIAEYYVVENGYLSPLQFSLADGGIIEIREGSRYIINCGSVGQPRDGNPMASFGVYDTAERRVEIRRVDYDIETAQRKILDAGLPEVLAERLAYGR